MSKYGFVIALSFVELVLYLSDDMYLPAIGIIANDLNSSIYVAQYTLSAWYLGSGIFQIPIGLVCDIVGRKRLILIGILTFVVSSLFCAITTSMSVMIWMRFLQGSSICCIDVAGYAVIHEDNDDKNAVKIISFISSVSIFAPIIGPMLGVIFLEFANWRYIFWFLGFCGLIGLLLIQLLMKEREYKNIEKINMNETFKNSLSLFINKKFVGFSVARGMVLGSILIWVVQSPLVLLEMFSRWKFALIQSILFLFFSAGIIITRRMVDRIKFEKIVNIGMIFCVISSICAICFYKYMDKNLSMLWIGSFLFFSSMSLGPLNRMSINQSSYNMSTRTSVFNTLTNIIGGLCVYFVSFIKDIGFLSIYISIFISIFISISIYYASIKVESHKSELS
jgi:MFS family permease